MNHYETALDKSFKRVIIVIRELMKNVTKTVYSLFYPETEKVTDDLWKSCPHFLYKKAYENKNVQNKFHLKFKNQWLKWTNKSLKFHPNLLKNFYPTAGSSEAIRESLAQYKAQGGEYICVFKGEYEGYKALALSYNLKVYEIDRNLWDVQKFPDKYVRFYISQPSSIDGNVWDKFDLFLKRMVKEQINVMVDVCYLGTTTKDIKINLNSPAIHTVFFSLSKVFGVYYHRIGGVFSRKPIMGLEGNQWFKNLFSLLLGIELMRKYKINELPKKYHSHQLEICKKLKANPSDVIMLANSKESKHLEYNRNGIYRFCITPLLDKTITKEKNEKS